MCVHSHDQLPRLPVLPHASTPVPHTPVSRSSGSVFRTGPGVLPFVVVLVIGRVPVGGFQLPSFLPLSLCPAMCVSPGLLLNTGVVSALGL